MATPDLVPIRRIRVLIVDDSPFIRNVVGRALRDDPGFEVAGTAADGLEAITKTAELRPDVVTLDVEMPRMNGLEAIAGIRAAWPPAYIVMLSTLTEVGARVTVDALIRGANDYVSKTAQAGAAGGLAVERLKRELTAKIRQFFATRTPPPSSYVAPKPVDALRFVAAAPERARSRRKVIAIGVSTGGPTALNDVIPALPPRLPVPVLIVQHMPPMFTRILAERLNAASALRVMEAEDGMAVENGCVLIAPGNYHMRVRKRGAQVFITLDQGAPENSCRPAVDVLLRSVNEVYGGSALAVILTGMGQDGLNGVRALKKNGAYIIAQDEASSVVWGMPGAVARAGVADAVIHLKQVVPEILKQV